MDNIGASDRGKAVAGLFTGQLMDVCLRRPLPRTCNQPLVPPPKNLKPQKTASKFWEHYVYIANSMNSLRHRSNRCGEERIFFRDYRSSRAYPCAPGTMAGFSFPAFGATVVCRHLDRF